MDLQYLLFLQHFREGIGAPLAPFMLWISDFIISFWVLAAIALIYWVWDRQGGRRILLGFCYGVIFSAILKLTFCIYRPWIRDAQIIPYGNAIASAGGYSFPSGHSTRAATILGGISFLLKQKGLLLPACLLFSIIFIVMFSRNYLGVHTPQDVIVGFLIGLFSIYAAIKTDTWTAKSEKDSGFSSQPPSFFASPSPSITSTNPIRQTISRMADSCMIPNRGQPTNTKDSAASWATPSQRSSKSAALTLRNWIGYHDFSSASSPSFPSTPF